MAALITHLELANWRNFKKVNVDLKNRMFVVGPNASGKTNLLDALRFLRDIARPGGSLVRAISDREGLKHVRSLHAGGVSEFSIKVDVTIDNDPVPWTYELVISGSETKNKPLRIESERVIHGTALVVRDRDTERNDLLLSQTALEQINLSLEFRPLAEALASIEAIHLVPQVARSAMRAEELSRRDAPGSDFIDRLAQLSEGRQRTVLRRIEKLLKIAVPRFSQIRVQRDALGRPHLEANFQHWRDKGGWQNEQDFSDGTLRLIGLLWALMNGKAPLLVEEPELSLHSGIIRQLPRLFALASQQTGRQVIVSTHAEEMLHDTGIDPSEILLLEPSDNETTVRVGSDEPQLRLAAKERRPLGDLVAAMTKPKGIEQLSLQWAPGSDT